MIRIEELEQSLLTTKEYMKLSKYYGTYNPFGRRSQWHGNPPPCWKMGEGFSSQEAAKFNATLEELRELLPKLKKEETNERETTQHS